MNIIFSLLLALISPIFLLPIEHVFNYPYVIEELIKFFAISLIIKQSKHTGNNYLIFAILVGVLFTISESILYLVNFLSDGTLMFFPQRLFFTGILHCSTCALIYILGKKNWLFLILGLAISILIHYYFNEIISGINNF
ncbi:MAG: PrsW family glutamic-type intramembrane protease [Candidatus Levybacteria bacterium]|nr:PrsW family glutamic-type intramembrane protease [Candidatus Levybacteria bacterium]